MPDLVLSDGSVRIHYSLARQDRLLFMDCDRGKFFDVLSISAVFVLAMPSIIVKVVGILIAVVTIPLLREAGKEFPYYFPVARRRNRQQRSYRRSAHMSARLPYIPRQQDA